MATKAELAESIDDDATYVVSVLRPFFVYGVAVSPLDTEVKLSGALVKKFKECLSSYTVVES